MICRNFSMRLILLFTSLICLACHSNQKNEKREEPGQEEQKVTLNVLGKVNYPKGFKVSVRNDAMTETLGGGNLVRNSLSFKIANLSPNKVYYLFIEGNVDKWQERIPFFLSPAQDSLFLVGKPYGGYDSDSKMKFRIDSSSEEQLFLNALVEAIEDKRAAIDNQTLTGNLGEGKLQGKRENLATAIPAIEKTFVNQKKPLVSTLYLLTKMDDFRTNAKQYEELYRSMPHQVKESVYGRELESRFKIINNPPQVVSLNDILAKDKQRKVFSPNDFAKTERFVLYFWASWDRTTRAHIARLQSMSGPNGDGKAQWIFLSMDVRYSDWDKIDLGLPQSYLLDTRSQQTLVKDWYMTELPFLIVVDQQGKVMRASSSLDDIEKYLSPKCVRTDK